jgi:hypothetical protein
MHPARCPARVGIQGVGYFESKRKESFNLKRLAADSMLQRHAIQELHRYESLALVN